LAGCEELAMVTVHRSFLETILCVGSWFHSRKVIEGLGSALDIRGVSIADYFSA
jgi:hypothetical protein